MMNDSGIEGEFRNGLWAECATTATYYENIIVNKDKRKSLIELMFNEKVKGFNKIQKVWRNVRGINKSYRFNPNSVIKERNMLFVGYAVNHADDVYRLLNPNQSRLSNREMLFG